MRKLAEFHVISSKEENTSGMDWTTVSAWQGTCSFVILSGVSRGFLSTIYEVDAT